MSNRLLVKKLLKDPPVRRVYSFDRRAENIHERTEKKFIILDTEMNDPIPPGNEGGASAEICTD